jgi:hypothetical protein
MKTFINLTNGIEILKNTDFKFDGFIRIQSTQLEQREYDKVIANLDSNFLMNVALGYRCHVVDYGRRRSDGNPRSLRQGLELILYLLNKRWFNQEIITDENRIQLNYFKTIQINRCSRRKIDYFKQYVPNWLDKPNITYQYLRTNNDGDKKFYVDIIQKWREIYD